MHLLSLHTNRGMLTVFFRNHRTYFFLVSLCFIAFSWCFTGCRPQTTAMASETPLPMQVGMEAAAAETNNTADEPTAEPTQTKSQDGELEPINPVEAEPFTIVTRTVPDDFNWKSLPIMPEISENAFNIYQYGISQGRNPQNISVIGDCQAIPFVFLGKYGLKQYTLESADIYLEKMIEYFRDSFSREGAAVRGGFTAAAVLSAVRSDPDLCAPGETPLDCEWRIQNPSIAFINLETWREEGTVDRYETYLRKIVEFCIENGTLPIIIMKADKAEAETHVINPAMARIAYEYDIPIINFWQAAQYLDNLGIDPEREGFHLSDEGYDRKQILALRTLYKIWEQVYIEEIADTEEAEMTATEIPQLTESAAELPELAPACELNCVYFDLYGTTADGTQSLGIYELDLTTNVLQLISEPGISLQDISEDQSKWLINRRSELYLYQWKTRELTLVLTNLYAMDSHSAYFNENGSEIFAIVEDDSKNQIIQFDLDTFEQKFIATGTANPINVLIRHAHDTIYWESGDCKAFNFCQVDGIWATDMAAAETTAIIEKEKLVFSSLGDQVAFLDPQYADEFNHYHNPVLDYENTAEGILSRRLFFFPEPGGFRVYGEVANYAFSPAGNKIFVLFDAYSEYFEKSVALSFYVEDLEKRMVFEHGKIEGAYGSLKPLAVWSPEGTEVLLLLTNTLNDRDYTLEFYKKDTEDRFSALHPILEPIPLEAYAYPHRAFWINGDTQ